MPQGITSGDEYPRDHAAQIGTRVIYPVERMKQVQSDITFDYWAGQRNSRHLGPREGHRRADGHEHPGTRKLATTNSWSWMGIAVSLVSAIWFTISLPFRLLFWFIALLGRLTGLVIGFVLMVIGMALWASPLFIVGIPLFVIGLVLTLRCLE